MYCVITREIDADKKNLGVIIPYGPFVSELLATTFAQRILKVSERPEIEWRVAPLFADAQIRRNFAETEFEVCGTTPFSMPGRFVKVSFPEK